MCLPSNVSGQRIQSIAAIVGSLLCFNFGLMFGITPTHVKLYQNATETPFKENVIDAAAANWVCSYLFLGVAIGALILGLLTRKIGPKSILYIGGLFQVASWFTIHFASDILHIYSSRIFAGIGAGAAFIALPIFINEITADQMVATAHTISIEFWRSLGILLGFIFAQFLLYDLVAIIGIGISLGLILMLPFVQESPFYYLNKRNVMAMEKSLRWYRGIRHMDDRGKPEFLREVAIIKQKMSEKAPIVYATVPCSYKLKLAIYCTILITGAQLAGNYLILQLYQDEYVAILFAGVQLFGATLAKWLGLRLSRKSLLTSTCIISCCILVALALEDKWHASFADNAAVTTITIALISLHILSISIGLQPLNIVISYELLPTKQRVSYLSCIYTFSWLLLFGLLQCYYYIANIFTLNFCYIIFAIACFFVALLALFILPDTENKLPEEVQHEMGYVGNDNVARITTVSNGHIHEQSYM